MSKSRQTLGRWGEEAAAGYLTERGYTILERNVRTPGGEIDLVALLASAADPLAPSGPPGGPGSSGFPEGSIETEPPTVVFVEVKTRSTHTFGYPEESVNLRKQAHLLAAAQYYILQHPELNCHWRIDVIAIRRAEAGKAPEIVHFENAIVS
jgi:putative endonuclease